MQFDIESQQRGRIVPISECPMIKDTPNAQEKPI
jgi:hypothetical protein